MNTDSELASFIETRPYIVAEAGGNHGGDPDVAKDYVRAAAATGADAIKFQLYRAEHLVVESEPPLPNVEGDYESQLERFRELELERTEWESVADLCDEVGIDFAASVFDPRMADFVARRSPFLKVASGDLTHVRLLRHLASLDVPVVLSTGCSTMGEIRAAVDELATERLMLLHCIAAYPTPSTSANLQIMDELRQAFDVPVGFSDHTVGLRAAVAAAARGAELIEKHFTLETDATGGDHAISADPDEFATLVEECRETAKCVGDADRSSTLAAEDNCVQIRRSLVVSEDVEEGATLREGNLTALRPYRGISPLRFDEVVGRRVTRQLEAGTILRESDLV